MRLELGRAVPALAAAALLAQVGPAVAEDWCRESRDGSHASHCEVRELAVAARDVVRVDARPNGGIDVEGWSQARIALRAKVTAQADDEARASELASGVVIHTDDTIRATGPKGGRREHWSVSFRLMVPRSSNLDLRSTNGGVSIRSVKGRLEFDTRNGGVSLSGVAGEVSGRTTNGGLSVELTGERFDGSGLDVRTTNGGVVLTVPRGYNAALETGTVNGGIDLGFPVTVRGQIGKRLEATLGDGGPRVRVLTTNGGVRLRES